MASKTTRSNLLSIVLSLLLIFVVAVVCFWNIRKTDAMWITFDDVQLTRILAMSEELRAGEFPVRMVRTFANNGGYMLFNFYSPLTYYAGAVLLNVGINPVNSVKILFQLAFFVIGIGMFMFCRSHSLSKTLSVFAAFLAMTSAYFGYDAYIRGALPELLAFSLIPWLFFFYHSFAKTNRDYYLVATVVLAAIFFYLHAITAFIVLPFLVLYAAFDTYQRKNARAIATRVLLGCLLLFLLTASYLLPVTFEKKHIRYDQSSFVQKDFKESFKSVSETVGITQFSTEPIKVTLGLPLSLLLLVSLVTLLVTAKRKTIKHAHKFVIVFLITSLAIALYLQHYYSWFVWQYFPLIKLTQFPYRYLTITTFLAVTLSIFGLSYIRSRVLLYVVMTLTVVATVLLHKPYFTATGYYFAGTSPTVGDCITTTWDQEYFPESVQYCLPNGAPSFLTSSGLTAAVTTDTWNTISLETSGSGVLQINKYYYPGWTAAIDGNPVELQVASASGLILIDVIEDDKQVVVQFDDTTLRYWSDRVTMLGIILAVCWLVYSLSTLRRQRSS